MNGSQLSYLLLGQISRWQHLGDGLHRGRGRTDLVDMWPLAVVLAVAAIVVTVIVKLRKRNDMSQPCNDPDKLFRELSLAHHLDHGRQKLLRQLAEAFQVHQPAEVFLQPALFQVEQLPEHLRDQSESIEELRKQLF